MGIDMQIKNNHYAGHIEGIPTFREVKSLDSISGKNKITLTILIFISILTQPTISLYAYQANEVITINADERLSQIATEKEWQQCYWQLNK